MSLALSVKKANPPSPFGEDLQTGRGGEEGEVKRERNHLLKFPTNPYTLLHVYEVTS